MLKENLSNNTIRHLFDENTQKWYFSIVDVVGIIAPTSNPRNYWKVLKNRLKKTQNQLVTECNQLKMRSKDGKFYLTDAGDKKMILKMVKMASPGTLPYFEDYFNNLEQKKGLDMISLKNLQSDPGHTYPQVKKSQALSAKKIVMKSI